METTLLVSAAEEKFLETCPVARAIGELPSMRILSFGSDETVYLSLGTSVTEIVGTVWNPVS